MTDEDRKRQPLHEVQRAAHYNDHVSGVEAIDVVEAYSFNVGNALKYVFRLDGKDTRRNNLEKAAWYLRREYRRLTKGASDVWHPHSWTPLETTEVKTSTDLVVAAEPDGQLLGDLLRMLRKSVGRDVGDLSVALARVEREINEDDAKNKRYEVEYVFDRPRDRRPLAGVTLTVRSLPGTYDGWMVECSTTDRLASFPVTSVSRYRDGGTTIVECGETLSIYSPSPTRDRRECFCVYGRAWDETKDPSSLQDRLPLIDRTDRTR